MKKILDFVKNNFRIPSYLKPQNPEKFWKKLAICSSLFVFALVIYLGISSYQENKDYVTAEVDKPILAKVKFEQTIMSEVEYVRIEVPLGVYFYSELEPEVREEKILVIYPEKGQESLPVVLKSEEKGKKELKITYHNMNGQLIGEKRLKLKFK